MLRFKNKLYQPKDPMILHRYELKKGASPMLFGPHTTVHYWAFEWFHPRYGDQTDQTPPLERIGMCGLPKPTDPDKEHSCLIAGLLSGNEPLMVLADIENPLKRRIDPDKPYREVNAHLSGRQEVSRLIKFLRQHNNTHFYMSSIGLKDENRLPVANIATFSNYAPPAESYYPIQNLKIDFEQAFYSKQLDIARAKFPPRRIK